MSGQNEQWQNDHWYKIRQLKPKLQPHIEISRQSFRGEPAYVLHDPISGAQHKLNNRSYQLIGSLDGERTIEEIWRTLQQDFPEQLPNQQECLQLIFQLQQAGLITGQVTTSYEALNKKRRSQQQQQRKRSFGLLHQRITLANPDLFLQQLQATCGLLFHPLTGLALLCLLITAIIQTMAQWSSIEYSFQQYSHSPKFWLISALLYPIMKAIHELAHGITLRRLGVEVRQAGISLLVFMPLPFVDASGANTLSQRRHKIAVSAAGIVTELSIAAIALLLWLQLGDGIAKDICFSLMILGAISSVLFNANPLLKFDGYFILSDYLEISNLSQHATQWWAQWSKRVILGHPEKHHHYQTREALWLASYGLCCFIYKFVLMAVLASFFSGYSIWLAAFIVAIMLTGIIVKPCWKILRYLNNHAELQYHRSKAIIRSGCFVLTGIISLTLVPLPYSTVSPAITLLPDDATLRSANSGHLEDYLVKSGQEINAGTKVAQLQNSTLETHIQSARARVKNATIALNANNTLAAAKTHQLRESLHQEQAQLADLLIQQQQLTVISSKSGTLYIPHANDNLYHWKNQGDIIAYVLPHDHVTIQALIQQQAASLIRKHQGAITVMSASGDIQTATKLRLLPASTTQLPSAALSEVHGGSFKTLAKDADNRTVEKSLFIVELTTQFPATHFGERVWVKFKHPATPLLGQWQDRWKQFLQQNIVSKV